MSLGNDFLLRFSITLSFFVFVKSSRHKVTSANQRPRLPVSDHVFSMELLSVVVTKIFRMIRCYQGAAEAITVLRWPLRTAKEPVCALSLYSLGEWLPQQEKSMFRHLQRSASAKNRNCTTIHMNELRIVRSESEQLIVIPITSSAKQKLEEIVRVN